MSFSVSTAMPTVRSFSSGSSDQNIMSAPAPLEVDTALWNVLTATERQAYVDDNSGRLTRDDALVESRLRWDTEPEEPIIEPDYGLSLSFSGDQNAIADVNADGIALNSVGEYVVAYDADTDAAITYVAQESGPGTLVGGEVGAFGIVVGVASGSNGNIYVSGGLGTPGVNVYAGGVNNIDGVATGFSGNFNIGAFSSSITTAGDFAIGQSLSAGTPGFSITYGIDLGNVTSITDAINSAFEGLRDMFYEPR